MMDLGHFANLHGRARTRKAVLLLERIEREWASADDSMREQSFSYVEKLADFLSNSDESTDEIIAASRDFLRLFPASEAFHPDNTLRAINAYRHALMRISGQSPADWDFVAVPRPSVSTAPRRPGMRVYLEDIRSPFNVGSVFRTAEALGFEEILLSPDCADPLHPRAQRTAMGTVGRMPWRRLPVSALSEMRGVFALEIGGEPLGKFIFPRPGIMVLGSEELGVSQTALELCDSGRAEIPLVGAKASLNVATAFGIAGFAWFSSSWIKVKD